MGLQIEVVKSSIDMSMKIIREYEWLLDLYVLDFFVDNHWEKLPISWQQSFESMDPQQLGFILCGGPANCVLPLSFLALKKAVEAIKIPRLPVTKVKKKTDICDHSEGSCSKHPRLKNLFLKHVKLKKRHEITLMADMVNDVAMKTKCNGVLDFGSGLGHLVRMLAYKNDLYACGIECQNQLTEEARKLDLELEYTASKHLSPENMSELRRPLHYNIKLSSHNQLQQLKLPDTMLTYGLVGLHPCGDLGPLLLRHFVNCDAVKYICVVGCCYMKLTTEGGDYGFPMSSYVKELKGALSYTSREIACHALEVYCDRLIEGNYEYLKVHAYRAALERILVERDPKLRHAPVGSIKHSDTMTFEKYCTLALGRLSLPLPTCPEIWSRGHQDLRLWRRVVLLYTLRLSLAPLVENVILLDRTLYVLEHGLSCEIHPVFDPKISPRNHIIIAQR